MRAQVFDWLCHLFHQSEANFETTKAVAIKSIRSFEHFDGIWPESKYMREIQYLFCLEKRLEFTLVSLNCAPF